MPAPSIRIVGDELVGLVTVPHEAVWSPSPDLIWRPEGAKSADIMGEVVDAETFDDGVWVQAQLRKHHAWLNMLRELVRQGKMILTAAMAKTLGLPWPQVQAVGLEPVASFKSYSVAYQEPQEATGGVVLHRLPKIWVSAGD